MSLTNYFYMGGAGFMGLVSVCAVAMLIFAALKLVNVFVHHNYSKVGLDLILLFGSLALMVGILGQAVGLFEALTVIEKVGDVSMSLMAGGMRVSMIAPVYGLLVFLVSLLIWGLLREFMMRKKQH